MALGRVNTGGADALERLAKRTKAVTLRDGPDALHQAVTLLAHLMGQCPGIVPRPA